MKPVLKRQEGQTSTREGKHARFPWGQANLKAMDLITVTVIAAVWLVLMILIVSLCNAASHADANTDRLFLQLKR
jgi:hypothetical protein